MDISLVILAAGIGSRFGGVKQLEAVGPDGEVIIDYSIHDAIAAGFNKIVIILRREIFSDFMEVIGDRLETSFRALGVKWEYVFQELADAPAGRTKPWGTGQALLSCRKVLDGPFAVINADDYYAPDAYEKAYRFLADRGAAKYAYGMVGFVLKNTLSDNGGVTRAVCATDSRGYLTDIKETHNIIRTPDGAAVAEPDGLRPLDVNGFVSMNMWMLTPELLDELDRGFAAFKKAMKDPLKDEYLLPDTIDGLLKAGTAAVQVVPTDGRWFGVTYREDVPPVRRDLGELYAKGLYTRPLYDDLK